MRSGRSDHVTYRNLLDGKRGSGRSRRVSGRAGTVVSNDSELGATVLEAWKGREIDSVPLPDCSWKHRSRVGRRSRHLFRL